jgi:hypothetical protein
MVRKSCKIELIMALHELWYFSRLERRNRTPALSRGGRTSQPAKQSGLRVLLPGKNQWFKHFSRNCTHIALSLVCLSLHLSACLSLSLSVPPCLLSTVSVWLSISQSVICLSVPLSVCLSVSLFLPLLLLPISSSRGHPIIFIEILWKEAQQGVRQH